MRYNDEELKELTEFDGEPRDMLVWNDDSDEAVIRQVVAKINYEKPWLAVLMGEHPEANEECFGGWDHAADIPTVKDVFHMTWLQFLEFVKWNNVIWRSPNRTENYWVNGPIFILDDDDIDSDTRVEDDVVFRYIDNPDVDFSPTKKIYNEWKAQWVKEQSAIKALVK